MKTDKKGNSAKLAMWYRDIPVTLDILESIEGNVSKECWRYLVGKICKQESEKRRDKERVSDIYEQVGRSFGYSSSGIQKIVSYSASVDRMQKHLPDFVSEILNGMTRLTAEDTVALAKLNFAEIKEVMTRLPSENTLPKTIISEQKALRTITKCPRRSKRKITELPRASVKDTPPHDPDAQVNALAYTIPSWVSMIERTFSSSNVEYSSPSARGRLSTELLKLIDTANTVSELLSEGYNEYK